MQGTRFCLSPGDINLSHGVGFLFLTIHNHHHIARCVNEVHTGISYQKVYKAYHQENKNKSHGEIKSIPWLLMN
jgi:hypothetical protein